MVAGSDFARQNAAVVIETEQHMKALLEADSAALPGRALNPVVRRLRLHTRRFRRSIMRFGGVPVLLLARRFWAVHEFETEAVLAAHEV